MAAPDQSPKITIPLVTREPSIQGPSGHAHEILREALAKAQAKKQTWHLPSLPKDGFR